MPDGRRGRHGRDDGVELTTAGERRCLELAPPVQVLGLVAPLLQLQVPDLACVELRGVLVDVLLDQVDGGLPGGRDVAVEVLAGRKCQSG